VWVRCGEKKNRSYSKFKTRFQFCFQALNESSFSETTCGCVCGVKKGMNYSYELCHTVSVVQSRVCKHWRIESVGDAKVAVIIDMEVQRAACFLQIECGVKCTGWDVYYV